MEKTAVAIWDNEAVVEDRSATVAATNQISALQLALTLAWSPAPPQLQPKGRALGIAPVVTQ